MEVYVPFSPEDPKTRLSPVLTASERAAFGRAMLEDVVSAVEAAGHHPRVLATEPIAGPFETVVSTASLSDAVNDVLAAHLDGTGGAGDGAVAVVMADLALSTPEALGRLFEPDGDVTVAPGRRGGTNALVVRAPEFRVDYHGVSFRDHRDVAERAGLDMRTVDSFRLATDIDEPADLVEVLVHGGGRSLSYLADVVELAECGADVGVVRANEENTFVNQ